MAWRRDVAELIATSDHGELLERVLSHAAPPNERGCRLWLRFIDKQGYGYFSCPPKGWVRTHRLVYRLASGHEIPDGYVVRHTCDVPACIEPSHLLVGTHADNVADKVARGRQSRVNALKTHCPRGHLYPPPSPGVWRVCRPCRNREQRERTARKRQAAAA